jgi:hypothetical protein
MSATWPTHLIFLHFTALAIRCSGKIRNYGAPYTELTPQDQTI